MYQFRQERPLFRSCTDLWSINKLFNTQTPPKLKVCYSRVQWIVNGTLAFLWFTTSTFGVYQHEIISLSQTLEHHHHRAAAYPALAFSSKTSPDLAAQSYVAQISSLRLESGCWQPETQSWWVVTRRRIRGWRDGVGVTEQERGGMRRKK